MITPLMKKVNFLPTNDARKNNTYFLKLRERSENVCASFPDIIISLKKKKED